MFSSIKLIRSKLLSHIVNFNKINNFGNFGNVVNNALDGNGIKDYKLIYLYNCHNLEKIDQEIDKICELRGISKYQTFQYQPINNNNILIKILRDIPIKRTLNEKITFPTIEDAIQFKNELDNLVGKTIYLLDVPICVNCIKINNVKDYYFTINNPTQYHSSTIDRIINYYTIIGKMLGYTVIDNNIKEINTIGICFHIYI